MWECKTSGGHFLVHSPQIRSFCCHRCLRPFKNYNPPTPRTSSARALYRDLYHSSREKAPWRCIIKKCAFTTCEPCAVYVHGELVRIKEAQDAAVAEGSAFNIDAEVAKVEEEGKVGADVLVEPEEDDATKRKRGVSFVGDEHSEFLTNLEGQSQATIEVDLDTEMGVDDGEGDEYSVNLFMEMPVRSAATAAASAAARVKMKRSVIRRNSSKREASRD